MQDMTTSRYSFSSNAKGAFAVLLLLGGIISFQKIADVYKPNSPEVLALPRISAETLRMVDMGLHLPVASLFWIDRRLSVLTLSDNNKQYLADIGFINELDPKFSTPYAFSILVVPNQKGCSFCLDASVDIGKKGVEQSEPDWRIPFYLATLYFTDFKDKLDAAKYFDIAARTPGAPFYIQRFSLNYGIGANLREETKKIWRAIYESVKDQEMKERAKKYLDRLDMFDLLQQAAETYRSRFVAYPKSLHQLVEKNILPGIPTDPFGFQLVIDEHGMVGVKKD